MSQKKNTGLDINVKTFLTSLAVVALLMIVAYVATFFVPAGEYARYIDEAGNTLIDLNKGFTPVEGGISFIKFILSPFLVLGSDNGTIIIVIVFFLLVIGGAFNALEKSNLMGYMLNKIASKYVKKRYVLLFVVSFFFMAMGGFVGSFEEVVPLVPICCALCNSLGFDTFTGLGISLLAVGCGFSSGVCNAFTIGVAQELIGLPIFSGLSLRLLAFVLIYILLFGFIYLHAKRIAKPVKDDSFNYEYDEKLEKGLRAFALIMGGGILIVLLSPILTFLQDLTLIIIALTFLAAGIVAPRLSGLTRKQLLNDFISGSKTMLPAAYMIMMASSVRYILEEAKVLDTILYYLIQVTANLDRWVVVLFIYLIVQIMDFFVSSGSAKAFMIMPIIVPIAQVFGISPQLCILAYAFGDGFSNVYFPTNPALLISLSLVDESYGRWTKWSLPFQILNLILTCGLLLLGLNIGY